MRAGDFDLVRLDKKHGAAVQQKISCYVSDSRARDADCGPKEDGTVEGPRPASKLAAPDFDGLLPAQVARLVLGDQLWAVGIGVGRRSRVALHGFQAFHTTTSFSRFTPYVLSTRS